MTRRLPCTCSGEAPHEPSCARVLGYLPCEDCGGRHQSGDRVCRYGPAIYREAS